MSCLRAWRRRAGGWRRVTTAWASCFVGEVGRWVGGLVGGWVGAWVGRTSLDWVSSTAVRLAFFFSPSSVEEEEEEEGGGGGEVGGNEGPGTVLERPGGLVVIQLLGGWVGGWVG